MPRQLDDTDEGDSMPARGIVVEVRGEWFGAGVGFRDLSTRTKDARKPLKKGIHKYMKGPVKRRFLSGGVPRWRQRKVEKTWPILRKTGRLMRSVTDPASTNKRITFPTKQEVFLESKVPYAPYHDKERGYSSPNPSIPGRPFLEMMKKDTDIFLDILLRWSANEARESFGNP